MNLPAPEEAYSQENESQTRADIAREDKRNLKMSRVGTFTPTDSSGAALTLTINGSPWYKGNDGLVEARFDITYPATADGTNAQIGGLPIVCASPNNDPAVVFYSTRGALTYATVVHGATDVTLYDVSGVPLTNANMSGKRVAIYANYRG